MSSLSIFPIFLALSALSVAVAIVANPDARPDSPPAALPEGYPDALPAPTCFKKLTKCCFKWAPCGAKSKNVPVETRCDIKRCKDVCKLSCKLIEHKHPQKACAFDKLDKGEKCGKFLSYGPHHKPIVSDKCFPVYGFKKHCYDAYDVVQKKVCKNVCAHVCELEKAVCTKTDVYQFVKLCPKLSCGVMKFEGSTVAPAEFVGKEKKLLRTIPGHKEIIGETVIDEVSDPTGSAVPAGHVVPTGHEAPVTPAAPAAPLSPVGPAGPAHVSGGHEY